MKDFTCAWCGIFKKGEQLCEIRNRKKMCNACHAKMIERRPDMRRDADIETGVLKL